MCAEIINPFPSFNGATIEVWEWKSNFESNLSRHLIIFPFWDLSILGKGGTEVKPRRSKNRNYYAETRVPRNDGFFIPLIMP